MGCHISLCMIVKDEESNLPACLDSIADLVDEIVVVDTGSQDGTREVARGLGAKVVDFAWCDDFAAARNESLAHAKGDWIFWLDADEWIDDENRVQLANLFDSLNGERNGYRMQQRSPIGTGDEGESGTVVFQQVRLFPNAPEIRWDYRVHEQIGDAIERQGGSVHDTAVCVEHKGYVDPQLQQRKAERNLELLEREVEERPEDAFPCFNLGWTLKQLGNTVEALPHLERSLQLAAPGDTVHRKAHALLARSHYELGRRQAALAACANARAHYPDDIELLFLEAVLLSELGDLSGAEERFVYLVGIEPDASQLGAGLDVGMCGYKARHNLARVYRDQGRLQEAETEWRAAVDEQPECLRAWLEMGQMLMSQGRISDLEQVLIELESLGPSGAALAERLRSGSEAADTLTTAERLFQSERFDDAERLYRDMVDREQHAGTALWRMGMIANHRKEFDLAWERHRQAIVANPALAAIIGPPGAPHRDTICRETYDVDEVSACPLCDGTDQETLMVVNTLAFNHHHASIDPIRRWVRCTRCAHGFANPRPGADALEHAYQEVPPAHLQTWSYDRFTRASDIVHELWRRRPGGALLDVGVGIGSFAGVAMDYGYRVTGIDVHAGYAEPLERLGVEFLHGDVETHDFGDRRFDVICLGDVLEHLLDPRRALRALESILAKQGLMWISTPNHEGAWTRALGEKDPMWMEGEHLQFFSLRSLTHLLQGAGLDVVDYRLSKTYVGCAEVIVERA